MASCGGEINETAKTSQGGDSIVTSTGTKVDTSSNNPEIKVTSLIDDLFPNENSWSEITIDISKNQKEELVQKLGSRFDYIKNSKYPDRPFLDNFHVVNINGDSLIDIIFHGWSGGEPEMLNGYVNDGDSLREAFYCLQNPLNLSFENDRLKSLRIIDPGCCDAYVTEITEYDYNDSLTQTKNYAYIRWTQLKAESIEPVRFRTINAPYSLRSEPEINDSTSFRNEDFERGNLIGQLSKGTRGTAYKKATDSTGRVWWLVITEPLDSLENTIFYSSKKQPTNYIGWLSSRYVKRIEE
jgi:hypothetical protein